MAPTQQHELDHADHTDQGIICPELSRSSGNRWICQRCGNKCLSIDETPSSIGHCTDDGNDAAAYLSSCSESARNRPSPKPPQEARQLAVVRAICYHSGRVYSAFLVAYQVRIYQTSFAPFATILAENIVHCWYGMCLSNGYNIPGQGDRYTLHYLLYERTVFRRWP